MNFCSRGTGKVPDVVFNNAAVCVEGNTADVLKSTLDVNYYGALRVARAFNSMGQGESGCRTVINISSGDGELTYLSSHLQQAFERVNTLDQIDDLLKRIAQNHATDMSEIAFGPTPAYSLSKAAMNAMTRVTGTSGACHEFANTRVIAVCPGDVDTAMCTDLANAISPLGAADDVVWAAFHTGDCPSGGFFRARCPIPW